MKKSAIDPDFGAVITDITEKDLRVKGAEVPSWVGSGLTDRFRYLISRRIISQAKDSYKARTERDRRIHDDMEPALMNAPYDADDDTLSNIRDPLTAQHVDTIASFVTATIVGAQPYVSVTPSPGHDQDSAAAASNVASRRKAFYNHLLAATDWPTVVDQLVHDICYYGTGFIRPYWRVQVSKREELATLDPGYASENGYEQDTDVPDLYYAPAGKRGGRRATVKVGDLVSDVADVVEFNCPSFEVVVLDDVVVFPAKVKKAEHAWMMGHRFCCTVGDVLDGARAGQYDSDAAMKFVAGVAKPLERGRKSNLFQPRQENEDEQEIRQEQEDMGLLSKEVELLRAYVRIDADGDGHAEKWCVVVDTSVGVLLSAYRDWSAPGTPSLVPVVLHNEPVRSIYGVPITSRLSTLQAMADFCLNALIDGVMADGTQILAYERGSSDRLESNTLTYGLNLVDFRNVRDAVQRVKIGDGVARQAIPSAEVINSRAQGLTAASDTLSGATSNGSQTATEIRASGAGARQRLLVAIGRVVAGCTAALKSADYALERFFAVQANGDESFQIISPTINAVQFPVGMSFGEWLSGGLMTVNGDPSLSSPEMRLAAAEKMAIWVERSPFASNDLSRRWQVDRAFLDAIGHGADYAAYIGTQQQAVEQQQKAEADSSTQLRLPNVPESLRGLEYLALLLASNPGIAQNVIEMHYALNSSRAAREVVPGTPTPMARGLAASESMQGERPGQMMEGEDGAPGEIAGQL